MNRVSFFTLGLCVLALGGLQGCALAVAGGVAGGVAAAQEGGISRAASDARIQSTINHLWFQYSTDVFAKLDMTVTQGRVLITGVVQDPEHRVEAVRLAWQPRGVKQVINEINVNEGRGIGGYARDAWITTKLRTALTFDKHVQSINYNIDTVQGTVYLIGVAQGQNELNRVTAAARTVSGVKQVVSYVKFAGADNDLNDGSYQPSAAPDSSPSYDANDAEAIDWGENDTSGAPTPLTAPQAYPQPDVPQPSAPQSVDSESLLWGNN